MSTKKIKKSFKSKSTKTNKEQFLFRIESCNNECTFDFPIHTHGLTKLGLPEFFTYTSSFGRNGGTMRIGLLYEYLVKPENAELLRSLIKGDLVKVPQKEVHPGEMDTFPVTYCMKRVSTGFSDVREHCDHLSSEFPLGTEFNLVSIWAEAENQDGKGDFGMPIAGGYIN